MCVVRDVYRKGNDVPFRLVGKALEVVLKQKEVTGGDERIFPYKTKSMGTRFRIAKNKLKIDIVFDDLREEGIRRFLESGQHSIEVVQEVVGDAQKVWDVRATLEQEKNPETVEVKELENV
jgi:hypothetical protein